MSNRGDLIVVAERRRTSYIGKSSEGRIEIRVGVITNITRDGKAKKWRAAGSSVAVPIPAGATTRVESKENIDVDAAIKVAEAHTYPGHDDQPMPWDNINDVRAALRPCRIK